MAHHQVAPAVGYGSVGRTAAASIVARPIAQPAPERATAQPAADASRVLYAQLTARVSAARAPPATA